MSGFDDRIAQLRARFIVRAREDRNILREAQRDGDRARLREIAHSLAGNGGIFGFPEISAAASAVEDALDENVPEDALRALCGQLDERLAAVG